MCDQILTIDNGIRTCESNLNYLNKLLKICQDNQSKGYNCNLISEQIGKRENEIENLKEMQRTHVTLCTLYRNLELECDYLRNNK